VSPDDRFAFVTNAISATVSVVNLARNTVVKEVKVGTEPRGCALTANGSLLYVANHTEGTVSIIDTASRAVAGTVQVGGRPLAVAITHKGTGNISDDTVSTPERNCIGGPEQKYIMG
jgi:YVTN family beta-propeller protein